MGIQDMPTATAEAQRRAGTRCVEEGGEAVGAKADEQMEIREVTGHEGLVCTPRSQRRERVRGRGVWLQTQICGIRYLSGHAFTQ